MKRTPSIRSCARVEEVDSGVAALPGEPSPRLVDLGPVELVVPEDVEDVRGGGPPVAEPSDEPFAVGREVPGEDDDVRLGNVRRDRAAVLEVQVGEDLNLHRAVVTLSAIGALSGLVVARTSRSGLMVSFSLSRKRAA